MTLLGLAFAYNIGAGLSGRELLSGGAARHRAAHPVIAQLFILSTIGHLTGWLPRWADPYHFVSSKPFGYVCRRGSR